jgi:hypothetical protein
MLEEQYRLEESEKAKKKQRAAERAANPPQKKQAGGAPVPQRAKMKNTAEIKSESEDDDDGDDEVKKAKKEAAKAEEEADHHQDYCEVCEQGGEIILCDTCPRAYHLVCVEPEPLEEAPEGEWFCSHCEKDGTAERKRKEQSEREAKRLIEEGTGIQHLEYCVSCRTGGELLCCETCPATFHIDCLNPPLKRIPRHEWHCAKCSCEKPKANIKKILNWRWKADPVPQEEKKPAAKKKPARRSSARAKEAEEARHHKKPLLRIRFNTKKAKEAHTDEEMDVEEEDEAETERKKKAAARKGIFFIIDLK